MKLTQLLFIIIFSLLTTISCGSDNDDDDHQGSGPEFQTEKDLFSRWTGSDGVILDLSQGRFNSPFDFAIQNPDGSTCDCLLRVTGTQNSGEASLSSCGQNPGGAVNPECVELNNRAVPWTLTKDESELRLCDPVCRFYR